MKGSSERELKVRGCGGERDAAVRVSWVCAEENTRGRLKPAGRLGAAVTVEAAEAERTDLSSSLLSCKNTKVPRCSQSGGST